MMPQSSIAKGKLLESYICDRIVALGLDPKAVRAAGSGNGNREKADINTSLTILGRNVGIEAKNHSSLAIPEWWRQTQKLEVIGREPILAFKLRGTPLEETLCVIYLETLLELIKVANFASGVELQSTQTIGKERELKWAVENLKSAANKVSKLL